MNYDSYMSADLNRASEFEFTGGHLALDYINTVGGRLRSQPRDDLREYSDLVRWAREAGILTEKEAMGLAHEGVLRPTEADEVLARARTVREAIYRIFGAVADGQAALSDDLGILNSALPDALGRMEIKSNDASFVWDWAADDRALDRLFWPVVRSAAVLLTSPEVRQVRQCAAPPCGWLFLDTSRNRSRRWCDMASCGNRAKARRHYQRSRTKS